MKSIPMTTEELLLEAERGAILLTVNMRLERHLRQLFDQRMILAEKAVWQPPSILSLENWLRREFSANADGWNFLERFSARHQWETLVEEDCERFQTGLLQISATAKLAIEAHQLLADYQLDDGGEALTADQEAFQRWRTAYVEWCQAGMWMDRAALPGHLARKAQQGLVSADNHILLVGFDDISPQLLALFTHISEFFQVPVHCVAKRGVDAALDVRFALDIRQEVRAAARWARDLLAAGEGGIGVVVPDVERYRRLIEREFRAEIDPESLMCPDREETGFNLSLGSKMQEEGLVFAALKILELRTPIAMEDISFLLRTPYLMGSQKEAYPRGLFEQFLCSRRAPSFSLNRLEGLCRRGNPDPCAIMADVWLTLQSWKGRQGKHLPGDWANAFSELLKSVGWPGERELDSREYQVYKAWREKVLPQLAALDAFSPPVDFPHALAILRKIVSETLFQPEGSESPVQIMGVLESAGMDFNHLWVMGLGEESLPAPPRPNPFLPVTLQRELNMPHASAERELVFAERVRDRLFAAAPQIVLSYPLWDGDCPLRPSPLLKGMPITACDPRDGLDPVTQFRKTMPQLQNLQNATGPSLEDGMISRGGTSLLKDQALCPFRAFARHRLGVKSYAPAVPGVDASSKGTLIHDVLEAFWSQLRDHETLLSLSAKQLEECVRACTEEVTQKFFAQGDHRLPLRVQEQEKRRIETLVLEWVQNVESQRSPFRVETRESDAQIPIGPLVLKTRIDRMDRLSDDSLVILDYKTGQFDLSGLLGDPLLEPQLAIYAASGLCDRQELGAVSFAVLRRGECAFQGIAGQEDLLPGVRSVSSSPLLKDRGICDWTALVHDWRMKLDALAQDFADGVAVVKPVDIQKACRYCELASLCRIYENRDIVEVSE